MRLSQICTLCGSSKFMGPEMLVLSTWPRYCDRYVANGKRESSEHVLRACTCVHGLRELSPPKPSVGWSTPKYSYGDDLSSLDCELDNSVVLFFDSSLVGSTAKDG